MKKRLSMLLWIIDGVLAAALIVMLVAFIGEYTLKPYVISFGDDIAIRCLHDGSIDATIQAYERAEWEDFKKWGTLWAEQYTDEEYRAKMAGYESEASFAAMQKARDYTDVSAGAYGSLAAVHADGTVAFNKRAEKRYKVSAQEAEWTNVRELELGAYSVLAIKNDGAAVSRSWNDAYVFTQGTMPETWTNVKSIANDIYAVGLKADGTVYWATFDGVDSVGEIDAWKDIVQVDTAWSTVAGLRSDGTVVLAGSTGNGMEEALQWKEIQKVVVGEDYVAGLKKDGTLVCTAAWALKGGEKLKNVTDVYANRHYVLAVLKNGRTRLLGKPEETAYDGARPARKWVFPGE